MPIKYNSVNSGLIGALYKKVNQSFKIERGPISTRVSNFSQVIRIKQTKGQNKIVVTVLSLTLNGLKRNYWSEVARLSTIHEDL